MSGFVYTNTNQRDVLRIIPDLVRARQLLRDLVWKDLRARYRYAVMGFLWAIIEPLAFTLILTFVFAFVLFDKAALVRGDGGPPFAVTLLCALVFWQYMATALNTATLSLVDNHNLVKKVHFPREVVPLASIIFPVVNLGIGFALLLVAHVVLGGTLGFSLVWFPLVFGIQFALTAGLALLFSCGHVHYRDVGNTVNVALVVGFYASPVFYQVDFLSRAVERGSLPAWAYTLYMMNPMAGLLTAYRQILFDQRFPDILLLLWPALLALLFLLVGAVVFRKAAPTLSDHL